MALAPKNQRDMKWSSQDFHPEMAVSMWSDVLTSEIAEMTVNTDWGNSFAASFTRFGLGPLDLNFMDSKPQTVRRSTEMVARNKVPYFELLYARKSKIHVQHDKTKCTIPEGGFIILNDQCNYQLDFPNDNSCLTVRMPEEWMMPWIGQPQDFTGRALGQNKMWSRPLAGLLTAIADTGLDKAPLPRNVLADQLGSLIALITGIPGSTITNSDLKLSTRIRNTLLSRHSDHTLSPTALAKDIGISVRHLHRTLAKNGQNFGNSLNNIRIKRGSQILLDPRHRSTSIGEIAWMIGYQDQSHFARLFKNHTGSTPSQYRLK